MSKEKLDPKAVKQARAAMIHRQFELAAKDGTEVSQAWIVEILEMPGPEVVRTMRLIGGEFSV